MEKAYVLVVLLRLAHLTFYSTGSPTLFYIARFHLVYDGFFFYCVYMVVLAIAVIKYHDPKQLVEQRVYFPSTSISSSSLKGSQGKN